MDKIIILERINNNILALESIQENENVSLQQTKKISNDYDALNIDNTNNPLIDVQIALGDIVSKLDGVIADLIAYRNQFKIDNKIELDELTGKYYVI